MSKRAKHTAIARANEDTKPPRIISRNWGHNAPNRAAASGEGRANGNERIEKTEVLGCRFGVGEMEVGVVTTDLAALATYGDIIEGHLRNGLVEVQQQ